MALENELQYYRLHLIDILGVDGVNQGKYTLVKGSDIQGPFETYEDAIQAGYDRYGLVPFLVKKIERIDTVHYFSRTV